MKTTQSTPPAADRAPAGPKYEKILRGTCLMLQDGDTRRLHVVYDRMDRSLLRITSYLVLDMESRELSLITDATLQRRLQEGTAEIWIHPDAELLESRFYFTDPKQEPVDGAW